MKRIDGLSRDTTIANLKARIKELEDEVTSLRAQLLYKKSQEEPSPNTWPLPYRPNQPYWYRHPDIMLCSVGGGPTII